MAPDLSTISKQQQARGFFLLVSRAPVTVEIITVSDDEFSPALTVSGRMEDSGAKPRPSIQGADDGFTGELHVPWYRFKGFSASPAFDYPFTAAGLTEKDVAEAIIKVNGIEYNPLNAIKDSAGVVLKIKLGAVHEA